MPSLKVRVAAAVALAVALPFAGDRVRRWWWRWRRRHDRHRDQVRSARAGTEEPRRHDERLRRRRREVCRQAARVSTRTRSSGRNRRPAQRETLIQNDQVKFIVATYSITDARKEKVDFAGPYLITGQSLLVKADNTDITGAESLQNNKKLCSVSGSTPAQRIKDKYPGVQLQQYDTYSACVEALKNGAIDAVTTDEVILAGYAAQSPGAFKIVGEPFSEERYGIGLKKGDTELRTKINDAITKMETGRRLEGGVRQEPGPGRHPRSGAAADRQAKRPTADVEIFTKYQSQIFEAFWTTIQLTVYSAIGALILGTLLAAMRLAPVPMLNWIGTAYVNVVRNTPLTLIILFCSFGLSQTLGITLVGFEVADVDRGQQLPAGGTRVHRLHGGVRV